MKLKLNLIEQVDAQGTEQIVKTWTVITNNISRALQMYDDETIDDGRYLRLEYTIID